MSSVAAGSLPVPQRDGVEILRSFDQWVVWRGETAGDGEKITKRPYDPRTHHLASVKNPATWSDYETARDAVDEGRGYHGWGFVLTDDDPFVFVDLDKCRDPDTGALTQEAQETLALLDSYTEVSPSGTGIHIIARGDIPDNVKRNGVEMYRTKRYMTVTERPLNGYLYIEERTEGLRALYDRIANKAPQNVALPPWEQEGTEGKSDDEIEAEILESPQRQKYLRLKSGDHSGYYKEDGSFDRSKADFAFVMLLAARTTDAGQIDRLFRRSQRVRSDGWEKGSYREATIANAIKAAEEDRQIGNAQLTELRNARFFVDRHGGHLRYDDTSRQWLEWDETRFRPDDKLGYLGRANETVEHMYRRAASLTDTKAAEAAVKWAKVSQARRSIDAMVHLAKPDLAVSPEELDRDPWLLNVQSGTIELRTGVHRQHRKDDLLTKAAPVSYDPEARCDRWAQFLWRVLDEDEELIRYVQQLAGYTLTGLAVEKILLICLGGPDTGKTTLVETLSSLLGQDYALKLAADFFLTKMYDNSEYDLAKLEGVRFAYASEAEEGRRLAVARLKEMSGGDRQRGRHPAGRSFFYEPTHKLWLATNHLPEIWGTDEAVWTRIRVIPFNVRIPPGEQDKYLQRKLTDELPGILNWALEGFRDWHRNGFLTPSKVLLANQEYQAENDVYAQWFEDDIIETQDARVSSKLLHEMHVQ